MSTSTAFTLLIAIYFVSYICYWSLTKLANDAGAQIEIGAIGGVPISTKYRGIILYSSWVSYAFAAAVVGILAAILSLSGAAQVDDPQAKVVAYIIATVGAVGAIGWVLNGVYELIHYRSVLREAEAAAAKDFP